MLAKELALIVVTLFTGAAFYIAIVEHPARLLLDDRAALAHWQPAYERGARMQASLALTGFLLAMLVWWRSEDWRWLIGAVLMVANWPYTILCIAPINRKLTTTDPTEAGPESRALLRRWGNLHAGRSLLGCGAVLVMLWALISPAAE
jgi:hypothetical protein